MIATSIRFFNLLLMSLLVGTMFGVWLGFNPAALTATAYVEMQQNAIRTLNVSLPAIGFVSILLTAALAVLAKDDKRVRYLLIAAFACLVTAGVITRFANQPINAVVITWSPEAPAGNWMDLRDRWWRWHVLRTLAGVCGLVLALLAAVLPARRRM